MAEILNEVLSASSFLTKAIDLTGPGTFDSIKIKNALGIQFILDDGTQFSIKSPAGDALEIKPGFTGFKYELSPLSNGIEYTFMIEPLNAARKVYITAWR